VSHFRYGDDKHLAEEHLQQRFAQARAAGSKVDVAVLRPAAVTGPRGRHQRVLFGLQSALAGQLKRSAVERVVALLMSVLPVTPRWCRQFVHEDDVADIAALLAFAELPSSYATFNIGPPGDVMRAADMAQAFGKRPLRLHPQLIRLAFFLAWHATRGRIPTARGTWKSYSYPIVVDGAALTTVYGYRYRMDSADAFTKNAGRYAQPGA
jgi:nucleoside-diphosphate-sugar epimerase